MYPVPDGDAIGAVPAIKAYATSGILENNLIPIPSTIDPSGRGRYLAYPPGVPLFFGSLMSLLSVKSVQAVIVSLSLARCASLYVFSKTLVTELNKRPNKLPLIDKITSLMLVASNAFFLFASNGRPEILSILLVTISLWAALCIKKEFARHILIQICIGLLFPVSIANGLIGASLYFIYLLIDIRSASKRIWLSLISLFLCIFIFAFSYVFVNVSLQDGLIGIARHARSAVTGYKLNLTFSASMSYYKSWIIFGILALVQLGLQLPIFWRDNLSIWFDKLPLILAICILTILVYYFGGRFASQHYNLYAFLPIYQLLAFRLARSTSWDLGKMPMHFFKILLIIAAFLSLLQPIHAMLLFPYYLISGSTYTQMKNKFENVSTENCHVVYTVGISMLDEKQLGSIYNLDEYSKIIPTERIATDNNKASCTYAFVQEVNSNSSQPKGMQIVADFSDRSVYTSLLRRLGLINSPKGYSFKVYKNDGYQ